MVLDIGIMRNRLLTCSYSKIWLFNIIGFCYLLSYWLPQWLVCNLKSQNFIAYRYILRHKQCTQSAPSGLYNCYYTMVNTAIYKAMEQNMQSILPSL
jgi:hypothetical protein